MAQGYIKLYRSILDNPVVFKDSDHFAVWCYLLLMATHKGCDVMFGGERIHLDPGQLTTGRKTIAQKTKVNESKVQRILKLFEIEQQIEQRTDRQCRLISILNWDKYQKSEQRNGQRVNNDWTTSEQRLNTNSNNVKKKKNVKNDFSSLKRKEEIRKKSEQVLKEINEDGNNY